MTYGKSTYAELADVLLSDIADAKLKTLTPETFMDWTLRAEERICRLSTVREEYILRYTADTVDYPLQSRPVITAATNTSPITITATAHGISNHKRVLIWGGQGNTAINGRWFTSGVAANTFVINPGAYISNIEEDDAGLLITTETAHGFTDGATITHANITAPAAANGDHVITLVDDTSYTIAVSPADPTFTNDDEAVAYWLLQSTGNGTYTGGARLALDSELPSYFSKIIGGYGEYGNVLYELNGRQIDDLNDFRSPFSYQWVHPMTAAIFVQAGRKYVRIDPPPSVSGDVTLIAEVQIIPKEHYGETADLTIHLSSEYDQMILAYMKARASERLGDVKMMDFWEQRFMQYVGETNLNQPDKIIHVDYE